MSPAQKRSIKRRAKLRMQRAHQRSKLKRELRLGRAQLTNMLEQLDDQDTRILQLGGVNAQLEYELERARQITHEQGVEIQSLRKRVVQLTKSEHKEHSSRR